MEFEEHNGRVDLLHRSSSSAPPRPNTPRSYRNSSRRATKNGWRLQEAHYTRQYCRCRTNAISSTCKPENLVLTADGPPKPSAKKISTSSCPPFTDRLRRSFTKTIHDSIQPETRRNEVLRVLKARAEAIYRSAGRHSSGASLYRMRRRMFSMFGSTRSTPIAARSRPRNWPADLRT